MLQLEADLAGFVGFGERPHLHHDPGLTFSGLHRLAFQQGLGPGSIIRARSGFGHFGRRRLHLGFRFGGGDRRSSHHGRSGRLGLRFPLGLGTAAADDFLASIQARRISHTGGRLGRPRRSGRRAAYGRGWRGGIHHTRHRS